MILFITSNLQVHPNKLHLYFYLKVRKILEFLKCKFKLNLCVQKLVRSLEKIQFKLNFKKIYF